MKFLTNFFKRNSKFFLIIFLVISFQVFCDVTIPRYTYNLVDIGIVNDGVTEEVPTVIRRSAMKTLTNFMPSQDKAKVLNSYSFINKKYEIYIKKYPVLEKETIYLLNGERDPKLDVMLENAILLSSSEHNKEISKILPKMVMAEGETLEDAFKRLTDDEKTSFIEQFDENKKEISALSINDYVNSYIKNEYKEVGFDVSNIKTNYIIKISLKLAILFILRITSVIYLIKKVFDISLNTTKVLSKDILDKVSKLNYQEIKKCDVKSLIVKNQSDIRNFPILIFACFQLLFYVIFISLVFTLAFRNLFSNVMVLKFIGIEILIVVLFLLSGHVITKVFKKNKTNKNRLIFSWYFLLSWMPIYLLLTMIVGVVLTCFKIVYIPFLNMNISEVLFLVGCTMEIVILVFSLVVVVANITYIIKTSKKIDKVMNSKNYVKEPEKPKKFRKNSKHYVEFKNVDIKEDETVCNGINFKINANSIFGILCSSIEEGNLITKSLLKLSDVKKGNIIIDGIDINDVETRDLRTKIYCFLPKNVWYYEEDLESTKFLKSPDIYILNDFNGDLDLSRDESLNYFITKKAKNKIIIILSTNIDNIAPADKLAVIEKGKLVGLGKHKELIKSCKEYKKEVEK